jgi:DNA-directed RNA polymerase
MATIDEQVALEYQMVQSGIDRFNKQLDDLIDKDLGSKTKHGRTIIKGIVQPIEDGIIALMKDNKQNRNIAKKLLQKMKPDQVAYLSLISLIDNMATKTTLLTVARNIGVQVDTAVVLLV